MADETETVDELTVGEGAEEGYEGDEELHDASSRLLVLAFGAFSVLLRTDGNKLCGFDVIMYEM